MLVVLGVYCGGGGCDGGNNCVRAIGACVGGADGAMATIGAGASAGAADVTGSVGGGSSWTGAVDIAEPANPGC